ncbi:hypothetical protein BC827DRAFT_967767 [Russula dissimulans]|nr:hypothetical protein BC827DRAFT_967767 [Russula dissimulans]
MNDRIPDPTVIGYIKLAALLIKTLFELCKMAATIFLRPFLMVPLLWYCRCFVTLAFNERPITALTISQLKPQ